MCLLYHFAVRFHFLPITTFHLQFASIYHESMPYPQHLVELLLAGLMLYHGGFLRHVWAGAENEVAWVFGDSHFF